MTPNKVFLTNVVYLPEKRQVAVEFSGSEKKFSKRYAFFPFFFIPNQLPFIELVNSFDSKKLKVEVLDKKTLRVIGGTFSDLKKAALLIKNLSGKEVLLLDAKRQFLVEKNWGYFDGFFVSGDEVVKSDSLSPPNVFIDFLSSGVQKIFLDLKSSDGEAANEFLKKICLSNILKQSVLEIVQNNPLSANIFLENLFFKNRFPLVFDSLSGAGESTLKELNNDFSGFVKINFLSVLDSLATFPFYNLGFDSLECDCCAKSDSSKVSPASMVEAEFLVDGTFFESAFGSFAKNFHLTSDSKVSRLEFQREWCLNSLPVGPFFKGQKSVIPLVDFWFLEKKGVVKSSFVFVKKIWFCGKNESFLSRELRAQKVLASKIMESSMQLHSEKIASGGILFSQLLSTDFSYSYFNVFLEQLKELSNSVFFLLFDQKNRFFNEKISGSIECIKGGVLKNFSDFAVMNGSKTTKITNFNAFVKSGNPFFLAKKFASSFNLPFPEISF